MCELGWSYERWRTATIEEFNFASSGYWKNKEHDIWLVREVVWQMIQGNPYIENKPTIKEQLYKLSTDKPEVKRKEKVLTPEELEAIRQRLLKIIK